MTFNSSTIAVNNSEDGTKIWWKRFNVTMIEISFSLCMSNVYFMATQRIIDKPKGHILIVTTLPRSAEPKSICCKLI
jgi:hypothetical protein